MVLGTVVRYVDRCPPVSSRSAAVEEKVGRILRRSDGWAPFFGEPIWICRHCAGHGNSSNPDENSNDRNIDNNSGKK